MRSKRTIVPSILVSALFEIVFPTPGSAVADMPSVLTTQHPNIDKTYPTWISAAAATKANGSLDSTRFHPYLWDGLARALEAPVDPVQGCIPQRETFESWVSPPDVSSLEATFRSAQRVLRARVVGSATGFDRGTPGTLFQAELLENFKGGDGLATYYFFVPVGRVKAGKVEICKTDYRFATIPKIGDEVVLLVPKAVPGDSLLDLPFEQGLLVLREDQAVLPDFSKSGQVRAVPRSELLESLSRLAKESDLASPESAAAK